MLSIYGNARRIHIDSLKKLFPIYDTLINFLSEAGVQARRFLRLRPVPPQLRAQYFRNAGLLPISNTMLSLV